MDYASTTPVDEAVYDAMKPYFSEKFFNASSIYAEGVGIKKDIEAARASVASYLKAKPEEVCFTASGTESDNLAIQGVVSAYRKKGIARPHIITTTIEHPAVIETCKALEKTGVEVSWIKPGADGKINPEDVYAAIQTNTVLISIIHSQNEIGVIQPTKDVERIINKFKNRQGREQDDIPYLHVDASQSPNYIKCTKEKLGANLITLDGSKIYGPKGVGILFVDRKVDIDPVLFGGAQEAGLRPGTENTAQIIGFAKALEITESMREKESQRLSGLQEYFVKELLSNFKGAKINGSQKFRLPNNINVCIPGIDAEFVVVALSNEGIMCSFMTACKNIGNDLYSYVIDEIDSECKSSSLRFTLGRYTKKEDIDLVIEKLSGIVGK